MDTSDLLKQVAFIKEIDKLKYIQRRTKLFNSDRHENDAEHSWHLAMMTLVLAGHANESIDVLKVLKMVLIHDLVEIDAGILLFTIPQRTTPILTRKGWLPIASSDCYPKSRRKILLPCGKSLKKARQPKPDLPAPWTDLNRCCKTPQTKAAPGPNSTCRTTKYTPKRKS